MSRLLLAASGASGKTFLAIPAGTDDIGTSTVSWPRMPLRPGYLQQAETQSPDYRPRKA